MMSGIGIPLGLAMQVSKWGIIAPNWLVFHGGNDDKLIDKPFTLGDAGWLVGTFTVFYEEHISGMMYLWSRLWT